MCKVCWYGKGCLSKGGDGVCVQGAGMERDVLCYG